MEGKDIDASKEFFTEFEALTSTTLRLAKRWFGSNRCIVADAWFSPCQTSEELRENDLHFILSIKNGHHGYPKKELLKASKEQT